MNGTVANVAVGFSPPAPAVGRGDLEPEKGGLLQTDEVSLVLLDLLRDRLRADVEVVRLDVLQNEADLVCEVIERLQPLGLTCRGVDALTPPLAAATAWVRSEPRYRL